MKLRKKTEQELAEDAARRKQGVRYWTETGKIHAMAKAGRAPDGRFLLKKYIGLLQKILKEQGELPVISSDLVPAIGPEVVEENDEKVVVLF